MIILMKKLTSLSNETLEKAEILDSSQMKKVKGKDGGGAASCTASCENGKSVSLECNGSCTATDGLGVICIVKDAENEHRTYRMCSQAS